MATLPRGDWPRMFPDRPVGADSEIRSRLLALRFTQHDDPRLHFEMSVPRGFRWRLPGETPGSPGLLVSLARGSPERGEIRVTAYDVPRELSPAEWAMIGLTESGHTLLAKREEHTPIGAVADLLTHAEGPDGGVIARTNMAKDGRRIFTITCAARADEYPAWASDYYIALATFKLSHPENVGLAEPLLPYSCLYPAVVGFSYPASWIVAEEALTRSACRVRLDDARDERPLGSITVAAREGARPARLVTEYFERLRELGILCKGVPALSPSPAPELFTAASMLDATGTSPEGDVEVRVIVLEGEAGAVLVAVNGPTRARAAVDWAIHQRAFEIARETVYAV